MASKGEKMGEFAKNVAIVGGGAALVTGAVSMLTRNTSWDQSTRGLVGGGALLVAGVAVAQYNATIGTVLGVAGVLYAVNGVVQQQQIGQLIAQSDSQRAANLTAAAQQISQSGTVPAPGQPGAAMLPGATQAVPGATAGSGTVPAPGAVPGGAQAIMWQR